MYPNHPDYPFIPKITPVSRESGEFWQMQNKFD